MTFGRVDVVLVRRLVKLYWPFNHILNGEEGAQRPIRDLRRRMQAHEPQTEHMEDRHHGYHPDALPAAWHWGRIRYFHDLSRAGIELDPIEIDNVCQGGRIYPIPVLLDGHHRLAGVFLAGRRTIKSHYGGRVDLLDWLRGRSHRRPE